MMRTLLITAMYCSMTCVSNATTWTTISNGFWESGSIWNGGIVPPHTSSDTFLIKHPIVLENNLFLNSGALLKIDSTGGLCGHHNISVFTGAKILKYGILELDSLRIPGGIVTCRATGGVVLTLAAIISNGGSLSVSGCSFSVGPWFNCIQPEYHFAIGITENEFFSKVKIFPNPGNGKFEISGIDLPESLALTLFDLLGRKVFSAVLSFSEENLAADVSNLEDGIYSLIITGESDKVIVKQKLIISK
jgi:hypothetical protein